MSQTCSETTFAMRVKSDEPLKGDLNGDGVVNVGDIMVIINIMAGK